MINALTSLGHLTHDVAFHLRQVAARITLVNQVRCCLELLFRHGPLHLDDAVLHFPLINDQNDQDPIPR